MIAEIAAGAALVFAAPMVWRTAVGPTPLDRLAGAHGAAGCLALAAAATGVGAGKPELVLAGVGIVVGDLALMVAGVRIVRGAGLEAALSPMGKEEA